MASVEMLDCVMLVTDDNVFTMYVHWKVQMLCEVKSLLSTWCWQGGNFFSHLAIEVFSPIPGSELF